LRTAALGPVQGSPAVVLERPPLPPPATGTLAPTSGPAPPPATSVLMPPVRPPASASAARAPSSAQ